jgi:hypothetical protein
MPKSCEITVHVKRGREFRLRKWIAAQLVALAGWVLGCTATVEIEN